MRSLYKRIAASKKIEYLVLLTLLVAAFAVRLYGIKNPIADWHSWRQVDTAAVAKIYVENGIDLLNPRYYDISSTQTGYFNPLGKRLVEFPIYSVAHALAFKTFPRLSFEIWGRLISIFCSIGTIISVYFLGKKYISRFGGVLAASFVAFVPFSIYYSRVILPEPMTAFSAILAVWLFTIYIDRDNKFALYASAASFAIALLLKPYIVFYALPIVFLSIRKFGIKGIFTNIPLLFAVDIALIPFFLWRAYIFPQIEGIPFYAWAFNGDKIRFRPSFWKWIFAERLGNLILGMWGLIPFFVGLVAPYKNSKKKDFVIEMTILGMFLFVTVVATASVRHDYYQFMAIPAIALVWAKGFAFLWESEFMRKTFVRIGLLFSVVMMLGMGAYQIKGYYQINHPEFLKVGAIVNEITPKNAKVIAPNNGDTVFLYYTNRLGWPVLQEDIYTAIAKGADYFVSVNNDADTNKFRTMFATVSGGKDYWILDLHKPIKKP